MEIIGGFDSMQLEALREEIKDVPGFTETTILQSFDDYGNWAASISVLTNRQIGLVVELVEQAISEDPIVSISMLNHDGSKRLLASNHAFVDAAFFWRFYEGLPIVKQSKEHFNRRNN